MVKHKKTGEKCSSTCCEYVAAVVGHLGTCSLKLVSQNTVHFCGIETGIILRMSGRRRAKCY
jgi:hypothetical protein